MSLRSQKRYEKRKQKRQQNDAKYDKYRNFEWVFSWEHLYTSYQKSIKGVRWKNSTQKYRIKNLSNLYTTKQLLEHNAFVTKGFYEFDLIERGKERHIRSVHLSERVVQRCLCDYCLVPLLTKDLIYDNGASLKNKGYDFSIQRVKHFMRARTSQDYALVFDFSKYFDNINHEVLYKILQHTKIDKRLYNLTKHFIDAFGEKGLGLGSQISQILAVAYPNELDHMIKEKLKIKHYNRYMDDGVLFSNSKEELQKCLRCIQEMCEKLGIILNLKKTKIIKLTCGINFLKVRFYYIKNKVLTKPNRNKFGRQKKKILKLFKKLIPIEDICNSVIAWLGHMKKFSIKRPMYNLINFFYEVCEWYIIRTFLLKEIAFPV